MEENTCDIVETFWRPPQWFDARGIVPLSRPPRHTPDCKLKSIVNSGWLTQVCTCTRHTDHIAEFPVQLLAYDWKRYTA